MHPRGVDARQLLNGHVPRVDDIHFDRHPGRNRNVAKSGLTRAEVQHHIAVRDTSPEAIPLRGKSIQTPRGGLAHDSLQELDASRALTLQGAALRPPEHIVRAPVGFASDRRAGL